MLYYKVFRDRDFTKFVRIGENELEKALAAFRFGTSVIFNEGALEKIGDIIPDYNASMGWNPTHQLGDDDWNDIRSKGVDRRLRELSQATKEKIDYLIESKQEHLIGKNADISLPEKQKVISDGAKMITERMKI